MYMLVFVLLALPKHKKKELDVVDHYETDGTAQQSTGES